MLFVGLALGVMLAAGEGDALGVDDRAGQLPVMVPSSTTTAKILISRMVHSSPLWT
jgi:hypothetical protein